MTKKTNQILAGIVIIAVILAVIVLIYVNLPTPTPSNTNNNNNNNSTSIPPTRTPVLTITYNDYHVNYTLAELQAFSSLTGNGSYIKVGFLPSVNIVGPNAYMGVNMTVLLHEIPNLPVNYSIQVTSSDNYTVTYTHDQIQGKITIYSQSGNITGNGGVTMLLAYKEDGHFITDPSEGPLRVAFIDHGKITPSKLWAYMVIAITIVQQ